MENRLNMVGKLENYDLYQFSPTLFDLFGKYYPEPVKLKRILRFVLALKCGYEIFYLIDNDNKTIAYCVLQNGKSGRFDFSCQGDALVGPVLVLEEHRGKSIAAKLIKHILEIKNGYYKNIYCYIKKDNFASIKTFEKVGFTYYSDARLTPLLYNVRKCKHNDCKHLIMKYEDNSK